MFKGTVRLRAVMILVLASLSWPDAVPSPPDFALQIMPLLSKIKGWTDKSIDPAQYLEQQLLKYQEPMNAVIGRGDSPVQQFYRGATVFVTGGSGFLGKQLIEKLFRSCEIKKMYVLIRPKKGKTSQQRKDYILKDPVFDRVRESQPDFADRIQPVEGDVVELKLGLSEEDWNELTGQVDTIFHGAATVRFDSPLRTATLTNVRGTREIIALARSCNNLKNLVYISTAYTHATKDKIGKEVLEQFYDCPVPPKVMIDMAETLGTEKLDDMTACMIKGWPNTYAFTKAIAEELIRVADDLPSTIIRPPIVIGAYCEPNPGWLDINAVSGPSGIILGIVLGILHVFFVDINCSLPMAPVDFVNNCSIAAGWDAAQKRNRGDKRIPIYTVINKNSYLKWSRIGDNLRSVFGRRMSSPKAVWYCFMIETKNKFLYRVLSFFLHYMPAYIADAACYIIGKKPKEISSFVGVFTKVEKFTVIFDYFLSNEWYFKDDNVKVMLNDMTEADRAIFNCDVSTIDLDEFALCWAMGIKKYIIKDGLSGSLEAYNRQMKLRVVHYSLIGLFLYSVWRFVNYAFLLALELW